MDLQCSCVGVFGFVYVFDFGGGGVGREIENVSYIYDLTTLCTSVLPHLGLMHQQL